MPLSQEEKQLHVPCGTTNGDGSSGCILVGGSAFAAPRPLLQHPMHRLSDARTCAAHKSSVETWKVGCREKWAMEVSRESVGELGMVGTAIGWALIPGEKVNWLILELLNPSLAAGPVLFQANLYSTHSLLTMEEEFSSRHLSWQDQLEAERVWKGRGTFHWSSLAWLVAIM